MADDKAVRGTNFTCFHAGPMEGWAQFHMDPPEVPRPARGKLFLRKFLGSAGLNAVYHFTFTGKEPKEATVTIRDGTVQVQDGYQGKADLRVTADSETWLGFLAKERSLLWALLRRRIRIKGSPKLLVAFGKCFPS